MKRVIILLAVFHIALTTNLQICFAAKPPTFSDISGHWAEETIMKIWSHRITDVDDLMMNTVGALSWGIDRIFAV